MIILPEWRNWDTRTTQNRMTARSCGFNSHLGHNFNEKMRSNAVFSNIKLAQGVGVESRRRA